MVRPIHTPQDVTAIYRQVQPKLKRYLRKFGVGESELDDLVQDCFVSYLTAGRAMTLGSASAFLVTTARHRAIDLWRKQKTAALHALEEHEEQWVRPAHEAIPTALYLERLMAQVDAMNSQHRSSLTFQKFYSEGKSLHEIAAEFGEPLGTVSGRVFRMRRQFRDKWRRDLEKLEDELERAGFGT
jgi:RNA polymerase sigma-70 factor (ECF subfamily)